MEVRPAMRGEIAVGAKLLYRKNTNDLSASVPSVVIIGFVPLCVGTYKQYKERTLYATRQPDGQIVLAEDRQLFVRVS